MKEVVIIQANDNGMGSYSNGTGFVNQVKELRIPDKNDIIDGEQYYRFIGDNIILSHSPSFTISSNIFTIECWVTLKDTTQNNYIFGNIVNTNYDRGIYIGYRSTEGFSMAYGNGTRLYKYWGKIIEFNKPTHIAIVFNDSYFDCFINGVFIDRTNINFYIYDSGFMRCGGLGDTHTENFLGTINSLIIWDGVKYTDNFTPLYISYDVNYNGYIDGVIQKKLSNDYNADKQPIDSKVYLYDTFDNNLVSAYNTFSNTGYYTFDKLRVDREYYIVAIDEYGKTKSSDVMPPFLL